MDVTYIRVGPVVVFVPAQAGVPTGNLDERNETVGIEVIDFSVDVFEADNLLSVADELGSARVRDAGSGQ